MLNVIENARRVKREMASFTHKQAVYPVVINDVKVFGKLIAVRIKK